MNTVLPATDAGPARSGPGILETSTSRPSEHVRCRGRGLLPARSGTATEN